ncbi:MAG: DedA family protein [bacterium]|nr:DedA family protein [bacterium]
MLQINAWLDQIFAYGTVWVYLAIFLACFIENIAPPFPGDSFIVAAGGLAAASRLDFTLAFLSVVAGGMFSIMLIYSFGRRFGRDYFLRKDFRFFSAKDILEVEERFQRRGGLMLVASRFVVGFRVALAIAAGISRYPSPRMFIYTFASYALFTGLLMYLGYKLVENYGQIEYYFRTYNVVGWTIVIGLVTIYAFRRYRKAKARNSK